MIKTFTLNAIDHDQATPESGVIVWHVVDENKRERLIKATTELSRQGFIKTVKPHNDREMPLVELLSYYVEGESFRIDFSMFNETFGYTPREVFAATQHQSETASNRMKKGIRQLFHVPF
ncbi:MAG: hypothetical protein RL122_1055 [Pseudomonadota bacterium]|jgi:hypothetical protein|uniref:Uncharacterized protein n=1 Tax=Thiothrix fructosivorans TaxID=111770 RepID=A0A8B0SKV9_9GAMM|nr:hypothetical protein [Thiothrix fructosivorans]MBO0611653.1 hypothetical protein [Thiothrix fructosivorans]QTX10688.1 hypothetical protein J1836_019325 [Thiothrix fructosivorans]